MFSVIRSARVAAVLVVAAGTVALAAPAHAAGIEAVACTGGALDIYIDEANGDTVTGSGTLTGCLSVIDPSITSGTISLSGDATVNTGLEVVTDTTDTITWNTGDTSTVSEVRTITGSTTVADAGTGADDAGLFNPSDEAEIASGTEYSDAGVGKGLDLDFTAMTFEEV